jgi:hypothetical protein
MHFMRTILRFLATSLFRFSILLLPPLIAVTIVFGTPGHLKQALRGSGVYANFTDAVLEQSLPKNTDPQTKTLLSDPGVKDAIRKSFPPTLLQSYTETFTDGVYNWLAGKTPQPQFTIDLGTPKRQLVTNLTAYAKQRVDTLPVCTVAQLKQLSANTTILDLPCRPTGLDTAKAAEQFSADVTSNTNFLGDTTVTADNLPKSQSGQTIFQRAARAPRAYQQLIQGAWIFGAIAIATGVATVLLHDKKRAGIKSLAWVLLGSGVFWMLGVVLYTILFHRLPQAMATTSNNVLERPIMTLVTNLAGNINHVVGIVAVAYIIVGGGGMIGLLVTRPKTTEPNLAQSAEPASATGEQPAITQEGTTTDQPTINDKGEPRS